MTAPVMDRTDVLCLDCSRPIPAGRSYSQRLVGFRGALEMVEVVCLNGLCQPRAKGDSSEVASDA
jgi:hypothetical protein